MTLSVCPWKTSVGVDRNNERNRGRKSSLTCLSLFQTTLHGLDFLGYKASEIQVRLKP